MRDAFVGQNRKDMGERFRCEDRSGIWVGCKERRIRAGRGRSGKVQSRNGDTPGPLSGDAPFGPGRDCLLESALTWESFFFFFQKQVAIKNKSKSLSDA